ncbi:MAG TPA: PAS domain S-box protein [Desulfobacterales bacterium]|nr:PAS domain S-box protein [Desulfobacterales bacterium]
MKKDKFTPETEICGSESSFEFERVLLVDDSPAVMNMLKRFMTSIGYKRYVVAVDGLEAVEFLRRQDFDLVITDIEMPGMDGLELLQHLREHYPDTATIAITGYSKKYHFIDVIKAGATDFITKPFPIEELEAKLSRICRERTAARVCQYEVKTNKIINDLLHIFLADIKIDKIFTEFMRHLSSLSWLGLEEKGAIFWVNNDKSLQLMAGHNLNKSLFTTCATVPFGTCLCGQAAQSGELVFTGHLDARHENLYEGMSEHGHYCVPMKTAAGKLLGVFTLYLKDGTRRLRHVENTLLTVAKTAAVVIQYHMARKKILINEQKFELVLESSPDGIMFVNESGRILLANRQIERLFGYQRRELLNQNVEMLIPKRFTVKCSRYLSDFFKNPQRKVINDNFNLWGLCKDGSEIAIEAALSPVCTENGHYAIVSIRDNNERRQLQMELKAHREHLEELVTERSRELRESEAQLRAITSSAQSAILMINSEGLISFWNEAATKCFGWQADEVLNKAVQNFIIPLRHREEHLHGFKKFIETGAGKNVGKIVDVFGLRRSGEEFPLELAISAVKIKNKWHAIGIITDVTSRKEAEKELRRRMSDLEKFNRLAVGRELTMIELKKEINRLLVKSGEKERYNIEN